MWARSPGLGWVFAALNLLIFAVILASNTQLRRLDAELWSDDPAEFTTMDPMHMAARPVLQFCACGGGPLE